MPDSRMPHDNGPDDSRHREDPRNWSDAFAALPLETPPRDAWAKVAAELRATVPTKRDYRPWWMALAAAVALAIVLPMAWLPHDKPAAPAVATQPATVAPRIDADRATPLPESATHEQVDALASTDTTAREPARSTRAAAPQQAKPVPASTGHKRDDTLDSLYAQSAQLESLIAQVGDERMSSGPAAALSDQLETRVALIDATLADPALDRTQRAGLWRERVDTLQQLAGFQSAQLLLSASGENYDGQLVAVY